MKNNKMKKLDDEKEIMLKGTLLEYVRHKGFDDEGKRLIAECPEFKLYELHKPGGPTFVVRSESVDKAYHKALFRIIDRRESSTTSENDRIVWAKALLSLADYTSSASKFSAPAYANSGSLDLKEAFQGNGGMAVARRLAFTIGQDMVAMLDSKDVKNSIEDCAAAFKNALRAYACAKGLLSDERSIWNISKEYLIIVHAEIEFQRTRQSPTKENIRLMLENLGIKMPGKDPKGKWQDAFIRAGLGNLP